MQPLYGTQSKESHQDSARTRRGNSQVPAKEGSQSRASGRQQRGCGPGEVVPAVPGRGREARSFGREKPYLSFSQPYAFCLAALA